MTTWDIERATEKAEQAYRYVARVLPPDATLEAIGRADRLVLEAEAAIALLFAERPEYRGHRAGQIVCQLPRYLPADFPLGVIGLPKDREVEAILNGEAAA
jgi:hypothetical protein